MLRQNGIGDLRDDRVVVADDVGEQLFVLLQTTHQVRAHLELDAAPWDPAGFDRLTKFSEAFR